MTEQEIIGNKGLKKRSSHFTACSFRPIPPLLAMPVDSSRRKRTSRTVFCTRVMFETGVL